MQLRAKKSLGQHFLICDWAVEKCVEAAELTQDDIVLEIGPGTGVLTRAIASKVARVIAVEKDELLADTLAAQFKKEGTTNVKILREDILRLLSGASRDAHDLPKKYKIVANIPYYLTARLLRMIFENRFPPELIVFTIQKEVAERMVAEPPHMNLLALSVQVFGKPEIIQIVPASCFIPKPRVESATIKISHISGAFFKKNSLEKEMFFRILHAAFAQKRKTLLNTLNVLVPKPQLKRILLDNGFNPAIRAEALSLTDWARLIKSIPFID